jgi:hypothetical protein
MIVVHALNRRVRVDRKEGEPVTSDATCNAIVAIDPVSREAGHNPTKLHFKLTDDESAQFDELAQRIAHRLIADIANSEKPEALPTVTEVNESVETGETAAAATA